MNGSTESYKNFWALALGIFWLATILMIRIVGNGNKGSISEHAASAKKAAIAFSGVTVLSTALLFIFFIEWFTPEFRLGRPFNIVVLLAFGLYGVAGVVPDLSGFQHKIHNFAALAASALLLPAMMIVVVNNQVGHVARVFTAISIFLMVCIIGISAMHGRYRVNFLLFEVIYFLCFDISILVVTYVR